MNYTWNKQTKAAKTLSDLFEFDLCDTILYNALEESVISTSFFLPGELLNCGRYKLSPLYVIPGSRLLDLLLYVPSTVHFHADFPMKDLIFARAVGISLRERKSDGKRLIVCKLWYGVNPWVERYPDPTIALQMDSLFKDFTNWSNQTLENQS